MCSQNAPFSSKLGLDVLLGPEEDLFGPEDTGESPTLDKTETKNTKSASSILASALSWQVRPPPGLTDIKVPSAVSQIPEDPNGDPDPSVPSKDPPVPPDSNIPPVFQIPSDPAKGRGIIFDMEDYAKDAVELYLRITKQSKLRKVATPFCPDG